MAIKIEPTGLAGMYGKAAVLAGRATAARTQAKDVMRRYDRDQQVQLAMLRMRNNNDMIRFREDMDLLARKRAQAFTLEQIEMRARMNSAREERDRQQTADEIKQGLKAIQEYPYMTDEEKAKASLNFRTKKLGGYVTPERTSAKERELQLMEQLIGGPTGVPTTTAPAGAPTTTAPTVSPTWGWPSLWEPAYRVRSEQPTEVPTGIPTADELRRLNTQEAYELGIKLGYWK